MMRTMTVTAPPNEAGSTDNADYVCEWMEVLSCHPTSVSASSPLSPESGCRCLGQTLVDGVYPNQNLQHQWVDTLDRALDLNRIPPNQLPPTAPPVKSQPDDEDYDSDSSAKRSWLYWWCWLCLWVDGLSCHPTSISASSPLSPESGCLVSRRDHPHATPTPRVLDCEWIFSALYWSLHVT